MKKFEKTEMAMTSCLARNITLRKKIKVYFSCFQTEPLRDFWSAATKQGNPPCYCVLRTSRGWTIFIMP